MCLLIDLLIGLLLEIAFRRLHNSRAILRLIQRGRGSFGVRERAAVLFWMSAMSAMANRSLSQFSTAVPLSRLRSSAERRLQKRVARYIKRFPIPMLSDAPLGCTIYLVTQALPLGQVLESLQPSQGRPQKVRVDLGESAHILVVPHRKTRYHSAFLVRPVCALRPREAMVYRCWGLLRPEAAAVLILRMLSSSTSIRAALTGRMRPSGTTILRTSMSTVLLMDAPLDLLAVCGLLWPATPPISASSLASTHANRRL